MTRTFTAALLGLLVLTIPFHPATADSVKPPPECGTAAPPCKNGAATCNPWERDWDKWDKTLQPGTLVTDQGTILPPPQDTRLPSQPPWWATLILGFVLGLFGDTVKRLISEKIERRRAKHELYDDLGAYLARVEEFKSLSLPDAKLWLEITRPQFPYFDLYNIKTPETLLRTDKTHGIRNLIGMLRALGDAYRPETISSDKPEEFRLRAFPNEVISRYKQLFDSKMLDQKRLRRTYKRHREPISKNAPLLI